MRYIATSSDATMDSNWTVEEDAWEAGDGSLYFAITGLTNGTGYYVQVRAVDENDIDGAWSTTTSSTPADHGDDRVTATSVMPATSVVPRERVWGVIDPADDEDYFSFSVSRTTDYWIYARGDLDTVGELLDSDGMSIVSDDYGSVLPNPDNFFIWRKLQPGTYYIKVTGYGPTDEPYVLRIKEVRGHHVQKSNADSSGARRLSPAATIDPEDDEDYFKLQLSHDNGGRHSLHRISRRRWRAAEQRRRVGRVKRRRLSSGRQEKLPHPGKPSTGKPTI